MTIFTGAGDCNWLDTNICWAKQLSVVRVSNRGSVRFIRTGNVVSICHSLSKLVKRRCSLQ
jgi:hypothetical protein